MGDCDFHENVTKQCHSVTWQTNIQETDSADNQFPQDRWFASATGSSLGLSQYRNVKEFDRYSTYSTDDTCSNTDTIIDSASVVSSQSSRTSATTESADSSLDDDISEVKHYFQTSTTTQEVQAKCTAHVELLSGLGTTPLTQRNIEVLQQSEAWEKERFSQALRDRARADDLKPYQSEASYQQSVLPPALGSKCNRRSYGSQHGPIGPPCKLKRDTESSDCFVTLLIIFATRLITSIWPLSASPPMMSSSFNGHGVLPLRVFIQETLRRSKTSYSTLQVALFYLILLKEKLSDDNFTKEQPKPQNGHATSGERPQCRAMQCGRRMFLAALMLASKYLQDRNYSTRAWSKISGLRSTEINENETEYLKSINYNLHLSKEAFENWSKIVLTLSKLSKFRPESRSSQPSHSPKPESGMESFLARMVSDLSETDEFPIPEIYSDDWWKALLQQIEPDLVKDSQHTDRFLQENVPIDEFAEFFARNEPNAFTTSEPAGSIDSYNPDMTFSEALQPRGPPSISVTATNQTPAASPAQTTTLPLRPQLRNLPTPQTTPRVTEFGPWLSKGQACNPPLRCSASLDALRNMRKQCMVNADLKRCPPPLRRPQSLALPSISTMMRPAESKSECSNGLTIPSVVSPTSSIASTSTAYTSRSRSSSTSSTSSSSSWTSTMPKTIGAIKEVALSSPLSRVCQQSDAIPATTLLCSSGLPPVVQARRVSPLASRAAFGLEPVNNVNNVLISTTMAVVPKLTEFHGTAKFTDEGYGSSEEPLVRNAACQQSESLDPFDAAKALIALSSTTDSLITPCGAKRQRPAPVRRCRTEITPSTGHKRTLSCTSDHLQENVALSLKDCGRRTDDVIEDPLLSKYNKHAEKQWQTPSKVWAAPRKPVSNNLNNKRLALHCAAQQYSTAPEIASQYLLEDYMVSV